MNFYKLNDKIVNRVEELSDSPKKYFSVVLSYSSDAQWEKDFSALKEMMGIRSIFQFYYRVVLFVITAKKLLIWYEKK